MRGKREIGMGTSCVTEIDSLVTILMPAWKLKRLDGEKGRLMPAHDLISETLFQYV
jgi:hypothetical protein